ncbi:hypothetical protein DRB06_09310 [Actinomyces sp. Z5]|uniref:hypothetical protein n=1 Tax=Actinomyces sp. Z5 TaxID=2250216 RepID=UPI000DCCBFED|nr:hypothetical protein [Actinomyces sp. Z5]RAX20167.1 hypothetical protein DRB06_09310 [Actinomyces sp. Z5]
MFDLIGDDGVRRPFTGDIRDLRFGVIKDRLRIDQSESTRLGLGQIPDDLEDQHWDRRWYPTRPEDGTIDYECMTDQESQERDAENWRRNRLRHAQTEYVALEDQRGGTRVRRVPPSKPRWADEVLSPVKTPPTYSLRLRRGFSTSIRLDTDQADRTEIDADRWDYGLERSDQDVWIVGLFRTTNPAGQTTFVLEHYGRAWAASRTDAEPWPTDLNAMEIRLPVLWLPVTLTPLPAVPTDPGSPITVPSAEPVPARVATDHALFGPWWRDGDPILPYRPQPWIKPAPNRRYYRQSEGIAAMFTFRRMQERQQSESGPDQEDTSQ